MPAHYDQPEEIVKAIHQPIISEATYWKAQSLIQDKPKIVRKVNEEMPLRGVVSHDCGKWLTAGNSKGKRLYYWYYVCNDCKKNFPSKKMHGQFDEILDCLSLTKYELDYIADIVAKSIKERLSQNTLDITAAKKELQLSKTKLHSLEAKYVADEIDVTTYKKWRIKLKNEIAKEEEKIIALNVPAVAVWSKYKEKLNSLYNRQIETS